MIQLILPNIRPRVTERCIEWLWLANAGQYAEKKFWFYPFKTRFLRRHAITDGLDLQTIVKKCWCGDGIFRGVDHTAPRHFWETCNRCNGTGIYETHRVVLIRWSLGGKIFHEPSSLITWSRRAEYKEQFEGLIKHPPVNNAAARRSFLRLLFRYEPNTLIRYFHGLTTEWGYWRKIEAKHSFRRLNQALRAAAGIKEPDDVPF